MNNIEHFQKLENKDEDIIVTNDLVINTINKNNNIIKEVNKEINNKLIPDIKKEVKNIKNEKKILKKLKKNKYMEKTK